jgi:hypothetical protein
MPTDAENVKLQVLPKLGNRLESYYGNNNMIFGLSPRFGKIS